MNTYKEHTIGVAKPCLGDNMKKCTKCEIEKPLMEFHKDKSSKDGRYAICKLCRINRSSEYYNKNKKQISEKSAAYRARPDVKQRKRQYDSNRRKQPEVIAREKISYSKYKQKMLEVSVACIYKITNTINNRSYIGETFQSELRRNHHFYSLRSGTHRNHKLQQDFDEYGEEAFEWSIIKTLPKDREMLMLEEAKEVKRRLDHGEQLYNKQIPKERE